MHGRGPALATNKLNCKATLLRDKLRALLDLK